MKIARVFMLVAALGLGATVMQVDAQPEHPGWRWTDYYGTCVSECPNPPYHCPCYRLPDIG